jgi:DNA-binding CsgD family transcriptional regulator
MGTHQKQYQLRPTSNPIVFPQELTNFDISNRHYVIISPNNDYETFAEKDLDDFSKNSGLIVGHLRFNDQNCIIVEITSHLPENRKPHTATLLTPRELEIVQWIAQGHSNKQVAHQLQISEWTVSTHLRRIFAKLSVDSRAAMVHRCASLLNDLEQLVK